MKVSTRQLAELTGLDRARVGQLLRDLPHELGSKNSHLFDSRQALRCIYAVDRDGAALDPAQERAALDRARREQVEIHNRQRSKELVEVEDMRLELAELAKQFAAFLEDLPSRLERDVDLPGDAVDALITAVWNARADVFGKQSEIDDRLARGD